eukprot:1195042-Prorocentrum_minimum.AAC.4
MASTAPEHARSTTCNWYCALIIMGQCGIFHLSLKHESSLFVDPDVEDASRGLLAPWPSKCWVEELCENPTKETLLGSFVDRIRGSLDTGNQRTSTDADDVLEEVRYDLICNSPTVVWHLFSTAVLVALNDQAGKTVHLEQAKHRWSTVTKKIIRDLPRAQPFHTREQAASAAYTQSIKRAIQLLLISRSETTRLEKHLDFAKKDLDRQVYAPSLNARSALTQAVSLSPTCYPRFPFGAQVQARQIIERLAECISEPTQSVETNQLWFVWSARAVATMRQSAQIQALESVPPLADYRTTAYQLTASALKPQAALPAPAVSEASNQSGASLGLALETLPAPPPSDARRAGGAPSAIESTGEAASKLVAAKEAECEALKEQLQQPVFSRPVFTRLVLNRPVTWLVHRLAARVYSPSPHSVGPRPGNMPPCPMRLVPTTPPSTFATPQVRLDAGREVAALNERVRAIAESTPYTLPDARSRLVALLEEAGPAPPPGGPR